MEQKDFVRASIIRDMSEGVLCLEMDGKISYVNPAAVEILGKPEEALVGKRFAAVFFDDPGNDDFNQTVLEAIYDPERKHNNLVPFIRDNGETRHLHVTSSILTHEGVRIGVIVVLSDITELAELKIRYAEQVTALLDSLVKAMSKAIDARSPYNANHTRNMVQMGERFLDYLKRTGDPWTFSEEDRHAFLMSVWLHDVGKLAVPLAVMDKAPRLGKHLAEIEERFEKAELYLRIAMLEGRISEEEFVRTQADLSEDFQEICRLNTAGYLTDGDLLFVKDLAKKTYLDGKGEPHPLLTEKEIEDLSIRKGTLTDAERELMQSHASVTGHILDEVEFPESHRQVRFWAASHHEFLNGTGYPNRLSGDQIPKEVRLLTILDIFEALTAKDRPYKAPLALTKVVGILENMAEEGCLDKEILAKFLESRAWEAEEKPED